VGDRAQIHRRIFAPISIDRDPRRNGASIGLLGLALKTLPVGTAYAVWTGIGTVGTVALGIYLFGEPATPLRLICIGLILAGIAGLRISS
jgi:quaternary ammonium compound-resistance protein SugE